jgi:hypothetical protein
MSELVVTCPDSDKRDGVRVISGIVTLFADHLRQRGIGGEWELELFKKTGGGGQERILFKRQTSDKGLIFHIRPLDRDSSWTVITYPPDDVSDEDINKLISKEEPKTEETAVVQEAPTMDASDVLCNNRIYYATVTSHAQHGFEIDIETKDKDFPSAEGYIDLSDLDKYDTTSLNKYPVGKRFRVIVCNKSKNPVICSTRIKDVLETPNARDEFTGMPDEDGVLSLKTYTCSFHRVLNLIDEFANVVMMPAKRNFITHDQAVEVATQFLLKKYNAKSINSNGLLKIISSFCGKMEATKYQVLQRQDDGYVLTQDAWDEIGGNNTVFDEAPKKPVQQEPLIHPDEPVFEIKPDPEPVAKPDTYESAVVTGIPQATKEDLEDGAEYWAKLCRSIEISSQISALQMEKDQIKQWLAANEDKKSVCLRLQAIFEANRQRVGELIVPNDLDHDQNRGILHPSRG